jgi:hypothetical protein
MTKGMVTGYPVRGMNAVLWRNPVSRDPVAGILRAKEQVNTWNILLGRGCDQTQVDKLMRLDISQGNGLSKTEVEELLGTPTSVGGLGWYVGRNDRWRELSVGTVFKKARILDVMPGVTDEIKSWEREGVTIGASMVGEMARDRLDLSKADRDVTRGTTEPTVAVLPYQNARLAAAVSTRAHKKRELQGRLLTDYVLREKVRQRDWEWIHTSYVMNEQQSRLVESRAGRRIWVDWLLGDLPFSLPVVQANNQLSVSVVGNNINERLWGGLLTRPKFNYSNVRRTAVTGEYLTRMLVNDRSVQQTG